MIVDVDIILRRYGALIIASLVQAHRQSISDCRERLHAYTNNSIYNSKLLRFKYQPK